MLNSGNDGPVGTGFWRYRQKNDAGMGRAHLFSLI
jgi:hypothetical protein